MNIYNILHSGDVVRFHSEPGVDKQKNSEHQWGVALILQHIYPNCSKELLLAALTHDVAEYFTGDIPFPAKKSSPELNTILLKLEKQWEADNGIETNLNPEEQLALKLSDTLEGMQYCVAQVRKGNINAKQPFYKWESFIIDLISESSLTGETDVVGLIRKANIFSNKIIQEMEKL